MKRPREAVEGRRKQTIGIGPHEESRVDGPSFGQTDSLEQDASAGFFFLLFVSEFKRCDVVLQLRFSSSLEIL